MKPKKSFLIAYVVIEAIFLIAVRLTEYRAPVVVYDRIMFAAIAVDFLAMEVLYVRYGRQRLNNLDNLLPLGFLFMVLADTFLCLIDNYYICGYFLFCMVETVYAVYLQPKKVTIINRIVIFVVLLGVIWKAGMLNAENAVALLNLSLLAGNVVCAWLKRSRERSKENLLFAIGITFFFGCDFSILIRTLTEQGSIIHSVFALTVWTVYIPAQVILLLCYVVKINKSVDAKEGSMCA